MAGEDEYDEDDGDDDEGANVAQNSNINQQVDGNSDATRNTDPVKLTFSNYPTMCESYTDPVTLNQKVVMVLSLPSGVQNTKIELSDDGRIAVVRCSWSKTIFQMEDLFKTQLAARTLDLFHPKIMCLKNGLAKSRSRIDATPDTVITIDLPIIVQTAASSWSHFGVKREDGTLAIVAEFEEYIKEYSKKLEDATVTFDH